MEKEEEEEKEEEARSNSKTRLMPAIDGKYLERRSRSIMGFIVFG